MAQRSILTIKNTFMKKKTNIVYDIIKNNLRKYYENDKNRLCLEVNAILHRMEKLTRIFLFHKEMKERLLL